MYSANLEKYDATLIRKFVADRFGAQAIAEQLERIYQDVQVHKS